MRSPAFQFYPKDFISDEHVLTMSMSQRGIYISLLCFCWMQGSIPADQAVAAKLCGCTKAEMAKAWPVVSERFYAAEDEPGRLRNKRLDQERKVQEQWREKSSAGGKQSAAKKAAAREANFKGGSTVVEKCLVPNGNSASASSSASSSAKENHWLSAGFASAEAAERWWSDLVAKHPNRKSHPSAKQAWFEYVIAGQFDLGQFERWYTASVGTWRAWPQFPNLRTLFRDAEWRISNHQQALRAPAPACANCGDEGLIYPAEYSNGEEMLLHAEPCECPAGQKARPEIEAMVRDIQSQRKEMGIEV